MTLRLDDPALYQREARKLAGRRSREWWSIDSELDCAYLATQPTSFFKRLARDVAHDEHEFEPLVPRAAVVNGKARTIYRVDPVDAVVWGTVVAVLGAAIEPRLPTELYSYRRGRSQWGAAAAFAAFVRRHCASHADPRERGLFVLRRDVRRYDENISTADASTLWVTLEALSEGREMGLRSDKRAFLKRVFRPSFIRADGSVGPLEKGIPTGIPTQTIGCNVYLAPLDASLARIPGSFYARFGDDIIFAHADRETALRAAEEMERVVASLELKLNPDKNAALWLTGPGRPHPTAGDFVPTRAFSYLGFDVGFEGARLRSDKRRQMWLAIKQRMDIAERLMRGATSEQRAQVLCSAIATAFNPASGVADRYAGWLRMALFARGDLAQLDYLIALEIAQRLSGWRGVRAFREYPPGRLRTEFGLPSLVALWDQARRKGRA